LPSVLPEAGGEDRPGLLRDQTGAQRSIGYVIDVGQPDQRARAWLDVTEHHANRIGALHGGIISMLLDAAMGFSASLRFGDGSAEVPLVTVSMTTNYVSVARIGQRVTATATVVGGGRKLAQVSAEMVDDDGSVIATATGVFRRIAQVAGPEGGAV